MGVKDYTLEEIQQFWYESLTKTEFAKKLNYKSSGHIKEFQKKYNLLDSDLGKNNINKKRKILGPKGTYIEDLTGQTFGKWMVIALDNEKTKNNSQHSWWICKCNCSKGTIKSITMNNLKRGKTKSCGCDLIRAEDLVGHRFGKLKVLSIDNSIQNRRGKYVICKCDCGNIKSICSADIKNGHIKSCGCLGSSLGEYKLEQLFIENDIQYKSQFSFKDLIGDNAPLRFDFKIIYNNTLYLIEFQGRQHYEVVKSFGGEQAFKQQIKYDNKKRQYCKNKKINLIEIPYWDIDKININYLKEKMYEYNN